jgi:hypothetical protein
MKYKWTVLVIVLVLVIAGIYGYIFLARRAQTASPTQQLSATACPNLPILPKKEGVAPAGTIDASSLIAQSESPTISGTFSNAGVIEVVIWQGKMVLPSTLMDTNLKQAVWYDFSDHGGELSQCPIGSASGIYSDDVGVPLQEGNYTVGVYTYNTIYTSTGYQGDTTPTLLATGILQVTPK